VFEYSQSGRPVCAITGGYVYRGFAIPDLVGAYLYADFCEGLIFALHVRDGEVIAHRDLGQVVPQLSSFGQDQDGELYALSLQGPIYRIEAAG
jgi:hypothetical protein